MCHRGLCDGYVFAEGQDVRNEMVTNQYASCQRSIHDPTPAVPPEHSRIPRKTRSVLDPHQLRNSPLSQDGIVSGSKYTLKILS